MLSRRFRLSALAALALSAALLTACAGSPGADQPAPTGNAQTPDAPAPEPTTAPEPAPTTAEEPTCETLIGESVVASFEEHGWTSQAEPLYIGSSQVPGGLRCVWADFSSPGGDQGQVFGWAPIDEDAAADAQDELLQQGWKKEDAAAGVYITESAETAIVKDEHGYGMTYHFGDGWVTLSDTKQGLLLIEWPRG